MEKKTAIQFAIGMYEKQVKDFEELKGLCKTDRDLAEWDISDKLYRMFLDHLRALLPTEQKQIEDAFEAGRRQNPLEDGAHFRMYTYDNADAYYNSQFKPQTNETR